MNIINYLPVSDRDNFVSYTIHNSYVEIHNSFIASGNQDIYIDIPMDVHRQFSYSFNFMGTIYLQAIINVSNSTRHNFYNIIPGSYLGSILYDDDNISMNKININGYVINNGVLS